MDNKTVTMAHGAGGRQTSELIDEVFKAHFANPDLTADDAAVLVPPAGKMAVSTDGFIVSPAFFPGGNIGKLSICGTVNDLACMGAKPMYLTCAFVIEEGFPMEKLEEIAAAMEKTAKEAGVRIVSGDTKVAGKGQVDGVFITTTGMGEIQDGVKVGGELAKPGDAIIVTGDVGRHGCTILLAREDFGIDADVTSDCAPLWGTVKEVMDATHNLHVIRDATRGGVGTVLYEIAGQSNVGIRLDASSVPVAPEVKGVCGMLGLEPLYLACEGRMVIMAPKEEAEKIQVTDLEVSDITQFSYVLDGTTLSFTKNGTEWTYDGDQSVDIDESALETLLNKASAITASDEVTEYDDLADFGLDDPANTVTLKTDSGLTTIYIGSQNEITNEYYLKTGDSDTIYVVDSAPATGFDKSVEDLTAKADDTETEAEEPSEAVDETETATVVPNETETVETEETETK